MSDPSLSTQPPESPVSPDTTHNVLHEPPHWQHHTMTAVISSTPAVLPHPSHHHRYHGRTDGHARPTLSYTIRSGTSTDLDAIHKIYTYYVLNSAISFLVHPPDISYLEKGYEASTSKNLPYLVAVSTHAKMAPADGSVGSGEKTPGPTDNMDLGQNTTSKLAGDVEVILGYAHVVPLSEKAGYGPAVELTMYLHPSYLSFGIGSALMSALETQLRETPALIYEQGFEDKSAERFVDVILVRMSDDIEKDFDGVRMNDGGEWPEWKAQRERNRVWYLRKGFEEVGRMKRVGEKFGKRADVIILQKFLGAP